MQKASPDGEAFFVGIGNSEIVGEAFRRPRTAGDGCPYGF